MVSFGGFRLEDEASLFSHRLFFKVYYILSRCAYQKTDCQNSDKKGIKRLLNNGTYSAAYPLHDVRDGGSVTGTS